MDKKHNYDQWENPCAKHIWLKFFSVIYSRHRLERSDVIARAVSQNLRLPLRRSENNYSISWMSSRGRVGMVVKGPTSRVADSPAERSVDLCVGIRVIEPTRYIPPLTRRPCLGQMCWGCHPVMLWDITSETVSNCCKWEVGMMRWNLPDVSSSATSSRVSVAVALLVALGLNVQASSRRNCVCQHVQRLNSIK